jgi:hypothetical protein
MEINSRSPLQPMTIDAPLPSQRQGSERACNLSVSSHLRVPNYRIGRDREKSEPRVLRVSMYVCNSGIKHWDLQQAFCTYKCRVNMALT